MNLDLVKRIWYLSPVRAAKVQASLLAHTSSESRGTFRQKARSLATLNGWACAVKICNDGMLEDTNSLDGAHLIIHEHSCKILYEWHIQTINSISRKLKILRLTNMSVALSVVIQIN